MIERRILCAAARISARGRNTPAWSRECEGEFGAFAPYLTTSVRSSKSPAFSITLLVGHRHRGGRDAPRATPIGRPYVSTSQREFAISDCRRTRHTLRSSFHGGNLGAGGNGLRARWIEGGLAARRHTQGAQGGPTLLRGSGSQDRPSIRDRSGMAERTQRPCDRDRPVRANQSTQPPS
jgi:hypothetical protein